MIDVTGVAERHECEHSEILVLGAPQRGFGKVTARQIAQWRLGSCNLPSMDGNFAVISPFDFQRFGRRDPMSQNRVLCGYFDQSST
jgi:hypothetical protein